MRRLFSTLEDRLPSHGALLLRAIVAVALIVRCVQLRNGASLHTIAPHMIAASMGLLLLFGAWTPVAGAVIAIIELMIAFSQNSDPGASVLLAGSPSRLRCSGPALGPWTSDVSD